MSVNRPFLRLGPMLALFAALLLSACATPQVYSSTQVREIHLTSQELKRGGIAFLTPSSATGQEEDKQPLALAFTAVLEKERPGLRILPLSETLSAVNNAGLANDYRRMFEDYRLTGLFDRDMLQKLSHVTGMRYLAQLKLVGFQQDSKDRWGILGLRVVETKITVMRLFLQIWDSRNGAVVWEGSEEMTLSHDSTAEDAVTFKSAVEQSARKLISHLP